MSRLGRFLFREPGRWQFWITAAFICKGLIFLFLLLRYDHVNWGGFWGVMQGDTYSYLSPIDNLIKGQGYLPDMRMPGYGIIYLPLSFLFSKATAYNALILLQFAVAALSVYPLALIAKTIFRSNRAFFITFYIFAISTYSNMFDASLSTESFTVSFLIFSIYFFIKAVSSETVKSRYLILSGLFLTEVIFLRPVFVPLFLVAVILLFMLMNKDCVAKTIVLRLFLFLMPFIFFDGLWTVRNYIKHKGFIPLATSIYYPGIENSHILPLFALVRSWGGSDQYWEPDAEIRWFGLDDGLNPTLRDRKVLPPKYIYTSKFNFDSLIILRNQVQYYAVSLQSPNPDTGKQKMALESIRVKCYAYARSIKEEKPFLYYILAPIMRTKAFLIHSGTPNLFTTPTEQLGIFRYCIKLIYSGIYLTILLLGAIGIIMLLIRLRKYPLAILPLSVVIYTIVIHPIILGMCEKRYFVPAWPFMLLIAGYAIGRLFLRREAR